MVGDDAELAPGDEGSPGVGEEAVLHDAVFVVLALGPGIAEVEMDDADDRGGHAPAEELGGVGAEHAGVGGVDAAEAISGVGVVLVLPLDAEEVGVGAGA